MSVLIDNRQNEIKINEQLESYIEDIVNSVLAYEECEEEYEISISFVDNEEIKDLNKTYRHIDAPTDVLSFPMLDFAEDAYEDEAIYEEEDYEDEDLYIEEIALGDIVISVEKAKEQALEYGHSFERELAFLLVHGMLHLLGYDHKDEEEEKLMFEKQDNILASLNINR